MQKTTRQWQTQDLESFDSKMAELSIFNEICNKLSCLRLKEIYPAIFSKTFVVQN